jgi:lysozyme family protein
MRSEFNGAFEILLGHEQGHVDHPDDPGGETKFGISKRSYPDVNIAALTLDDAKAIYRRDYWRRVKADEIPEELRFIVFDAAVNAGVAQSIKWLQRAVRVRDDGVIGPLTLAAIADSNPHQIAANFLGQRLKHMTGLRHWDQFGRGWARRISDNLTSLSSF